MVCEDRDRSADAGAKIFEKVRDFALTDRGPALFCPSAKWRSRVFLGCPSWLNASRGLLVFQQAGGVCRGVEEERLIFESLVPKAFGMEMSAKIELCVISSSFFEQEILIGQTLDLWRRSMTAQARFRQ